MLKKNVTFKDVAKMAGVSTATVARVLHNQGYIAEETRKLVEDALQKTGYRMNIVAQGLRTQRTMSIGHLIHSISPNPFFASVALGAEQEAQQHGWSVLTMNVQGNSQQERFGVETFIQRRVDAILFTTPIDAANVRLALDAGLVVVQVERPTPLPTHAVTIDNYVGSVEATRHLISLGHRRIAYIGGGLELNQSTLYVNKQVEEERLSGLLDTLHASSLAVESDLIVHGRYFSEADKGFMSDGYRYMKQFLQRKERPTAVFATSDMLAANVLQALYEEKISVPDDISIIGFDNTYAPYLAPPLTTVEQPMTAIGREAVRIVLEVCQGNAEQSTANKCVRLSTHLLIRASTGPVSTT